MKNKSKVSIIYIEKEITFPHFRLVDMRKIWGYSRQIKQECTILMYEECNVKPSMKSEALVYINKVRIYKQKMKHPFFFFFFYIMPKPLLSFSITKENDANLPKKMQANSSGVIMQTIF